MNTIIKKCIICERSDNLVNYRTSGNYYCGKHSNQLYTQGRIIENTIKDKNEIKCEGDECYIILRNARREIVGEAIICKEDVEKISNHIWCLNSVGYVVTASKIKEEKSVLLLHRLILHPKDSEIVDHIDNNPLNNKKENLRIVSKSQNGMNSRTPSNNTSGVKGVSWDKKSNKWHAYIKINYKRINLGYFKKLDDASRAREKAEEKYFKEFRYKGESNK